MHTWNWQTWQGLPYLTCSLLQDWQHGFFSQHFGSRSPAELTQILHPSAAVFRIKQVHGNTVLSTTTLSTTALSTTTLSTTALSTTTLSTTALSASEPCAPQIENNLSELAAELEAESEAKKSFPEADGLISQQANQSIWVCSADCTPALIADVETGQVSAIHAGWRGTALKIVPMAIARLQSQGSQLQHLRIAMGPAIAGEVYQVSTTVAAQVGATLLTEPIDTTNLELMLEYLKQIPNSPILDDLQAGRARLDVRRVNQLQLEQLGISPEQISIAPYCTYQNPELFFSYRRTHQKQVQWSGIISQ
jgi:polyphenol oxidase